MKVFTAYFLISLASFASAIAQSIPEKGVPLLESFTPVDYHHKGKVWDIDTAPNGLAYMAADEGLLEYDGKTWKYYVGSEGITRSVVVVNDSILYTGSDLDFGIWKKNRYSEFEYTSLYPFKEDLTNSSEEFWDVFIVNESPFFISEKNIYIYKNQNLTKVPAPGRILESFRFGKEIYLVEETEGLLRLEDLSPKKIFDLNSTNDVGIVGMYENREEKVFVSQNSGLLAFENGQLTAIENEISQELRAANVFSFERIGESYLAFGTILNGLYITDYEGNLLHHINKSKGLQNNTILSMHYSSNGKLWLGMDYGLSYVDLSNNYTVIYDNRGNFGTAYSAVLKGDTFYLGTNQGLYKARWEELNNSNEFYDFELIEGTEGQVWSLNEINDEIWISHDRGLFTIRNDQIARVSERRGFWMVEPYENYLLAGTYNGISIFEKSGNQWNYLRQMELIAGSCNQLFIDDQDYLWVNIPNFGVIRAHIDDSLYPENREIFESEQFVGSDHYIEKNKDGIFVITDQYRYEYNVNENRFTESPRQEENTRIKDLLLRNGRSSYLNDQYEFFPVYNGFALRDLNMSSGSEEPDSSLKLIFRDAWAFNNDERKQTYEGSEISYRFNNLRLEAIAPNQENVLYQFWSDKSGSWTEPSPNNTFEIIGLSYGNHIVKSRAIIEGNFTSEATFSFDVMPPWYRTWYAYAGYALLLVALFYLLYLWLTISLDKQKKHLLTDQRKSLKKQQQRFQEQLKRVEQEKLRAEYKNLKSEFKTKTIELATKAKENDEKNRILKSLKKKLEKIDENPKSFKRRYGEIKQIIESHIGTEDNTFEIQIDQLHQEFFEKLREDFPDLTRYDLRLCAYIKIGFDSKEISDLLNIKPSSVYISRSRVRKKLNIKSDEDLHGYLNSI
ncbi:LuxR C-terminal-related transcriptional regulator [Gracilimonas sp.]|uniref:LuxR C-terminal-related transcriptional regulator n=1 Tax=Gracilimonas sp. TaxID=1974203 RepID=UPI0032ED8D62